MGIFSKIKELFGNSANEAERIRLQMENEALKLALSNATKPTIEVVEPVVEPVKLVSAEPALPPVPKQYTPISAIPVADRPRALNTEYKLNPEAFAKFSNTLRGYQRKSVDALAEVVIGQVNIPTGTGKTYIQKHILVEDMLTKQNGVYVIASHRLALCTQLFNQVIDLMANCGIKANLIYVGSDRYNFDKLNAKYRHLGYHIDEDDGGQTTSGIRVAELVSKAKSEGKHSVIVATYASFHRLATIGNIDIACFDEAHTTIADNYHDNIAEVKSNIAKQYFFTATRKVSGDNGGQNDTDFYGEVVYQMSPKEAINKGEIVRPRIHYVRTRDEDVVDIDDNNIEMILNTIFDAFTEHRTKVKEHSFAPETIGAKMLISVNGLEELRRVYNNPRFVTWCKNNSIRTFAFSSVDGEFVDFTPSVRQMALEAMNELGSADDAIMFHYDILTEGIDLPAITGVLLLRDLPLTKLLQSIGRGARLWVDDRTRLYANEIKPHEVEKMVKPYCWVIIPEYLKTLKGGARIVDIIKSVRDSYDIPVELIGEEDDALALQAHLLPSLTQDDHANHRNPMSDLDHIFEEIIIEEVDEIINEKDTSVARGVFHRLVGE